MRCLRSPAPLPALRLSGDSQEPRAGSPLPGLSFWLLPCSELVAQSLRPPQGLRRRTRVGQQKVEKRDYAGLLQPPCEGVWFDRAFLGRSPAFERIDGPSVQ